MHPIIHSSNFRDCVWKQDSECYPLLNKIINECWDKIYSEPINYEITVRNLLTEIFAVIINECEMINSANQSNNLLLEDRVQIILNYIHTNYSKNITLDDLASAANVSKSEVLRCFKTIIKTSPIKYLKNFRLQNAAYMLKTTTHSIQTIFELCGFDDNSYFSKSFKEIYHCSPREYREL